MSRFYKLWTVASLFALLGTAISSSYNDRQFASHWLKAQNRQREADSDFAEILHRIEADLDTIKAQVAPANSTLIRPRVGGWLYEYDCPDWRNPVILSPESIPGYLWQNWPESAKAGPYNLIADSVYVNGKWIPALTPPPYDSLFPPEKQEDRTVTKPALVPSFCTDLLVQIGDIRCRPDTTWEPINSGD